MGEPERAIDCDGLTRSFPAGVALDALTLDVRRGEVLALLGPNGAGKTTTMRLLNGVLQPDRGTATVLGLDPWTDGEAVRHRTGVLTENAGLDERFTALENLEFVGRLRGMGGDEARRRGGELLERFGMSDRADVRVQGFSTGQRKRVALARALLHDPELLFLDEPTSGLDPAATRDVVELIGSLASDHGRTVVLCTHFLGEAGKLASRMAVLFRGVLHAFGTPEELARDLWSAFEVRLDLGAAASGPLLARLGELGPVHGAAPTSSGALVRLEQRDDIPAVVAACVAAGAEVYAVEPRDPNLEDLYFAIEARAAGTVAAGAP
ncbi:MAG: ABC transporter ATP-binding protein [Acidimicrobiales bacterium]|nr:ABC transporter ATP-binding protein [Acidimicrobiales bacterium]HRW38672.1 ABC transporter ATP-binding protein [Aquihabitans sp.]